MTKLFEGAMKNKKAVLAGIGLSVLFFLVQFGYQFMLVNDAKIGIIRSAAFVSATLIALSLLTGPFSRVFPSRNYVAHRRSLGVLGLTFGIVHILSVTAFVLNFDILSTFSILNPFINPLLFGAAAFIIYLPLYFTSTDWANAKLGFKAWKAIHRLVYIAWVLTVIHFVTTNTSALFNASGYLLLALTLLVFIFETAAFILWPRHGKNTIIGIILHMIGAALIFWTYTSAIYAANDVRTIITYGAILYVIGVAVLVVVKKFRSPKKNQPTVPAPSPAPQPSRPEPVPPGPPSGSEPSA